MALNDRQQRFCDEYLIDLNATQAAIRAGYSQKTAGQIGEQNLKKLEIQKYIQAKQLELQENTGITIKRVLEEYAKLAFSDIRKFYTVDGGLKNIHDLDDDCAATLSCVESYEERVSDPDSEENIVVGTNRKIKTYDKIKALDSLARHLGMFEKDNEQQSIKVNIGQPDLSKLTDDELRTLVKLQSKSGISKA